jgi:hypothetical protein
MTPNQNREGARRTCPYCGQASSFSLQTRVPDRGDHAPGTPPAPAEYKPGWTCENKHCSQRYDFNK